MDREIHVQLHIAYLTEKSQVEPEPELPALVQKAQNDGLKMFKLGRFAEAAEYYTQAIDILQKGKKAKLM